MLRLALCFVLLVFCRMRVLRRLPAFLTPHARGLIRDPVLDFASEVGSNASVRCLSFLRPR
jgi:hypothetical protein